MFGDKILGLDIGSVNTRLALLNPGKKNEILNIVTISTPPGSVSEGRILNVQRVSSAIKNVVKEKKINAKKLAVCVNSPQASVRDFKLPALDEVQIRSALEFELSQMFPNISQNYSIGFKIYERKKDSVYGIATLCPKKIIEDYTLLASSIGIPLRYIDVSANCITKAYNNFVSLDGTEEAAMVVDIGFDSSQVNVLIDRKLVLSSKAPGAGFKVSNQNDTSFGSNVYAVKSIKKAHDNRSNNFETASENVKNSYERLTVQIKQTLDFYTFNKFRGRIRQILLAGDGSVIPGADKYFRGMLDMPVSVIKPINRNLIEENDFACFMPAIGAALRED
ncbi:MAG: pilus assembly protein PilM [Clostridia bacterium]|nr:pilus assembly protein PilM [Clostridia bacterium]